MAYSYVSYTSTGGQIYNVPFPYLDADHVKVLINGVETSAFTWSDGATIHLDDAPAVGATITVKRETPRDGMDYSFSAQPRLKGEDLDNALLQVYYIGLEGIDAADSSFMASFINAAEAAQAAAEGARDTALVAQGAAEYAKNAAVVAQGLAEYAANLAASYAGSAGAGTYMEVPTAPSTDANEVKMYAKDVTGVTELFIRKESDGAEIQVTSGSILNGTPPDASEGTKGIAELATQAETNAGTDDARIVTPKKLASYTGLRGMKNLLINGSMVIGQRAADQTLDQTPRYGRVDRWHAFWSSATGVTPGTQGHQNSVNTESYNVMVLTPLTCSATNSLLIGQRIESVNSRYLRFANDYGGVSFRIKVWHNFGVDVSMKCVVYTADATDNFSAITSRYTSGARVIPPGTFATLKFEGFNIGTADVEKGVVVYLKVDTPICSGATMYLGDAQLEIGPACTDLEKRQYGLELALCQRYYEKSYNYAIAPGAASSDGCVLELVSRNSSGTTYGAKFAVEKRAVPTVTCFSDQDGASGYCYNNGNKACAAGRIGTAGFSYASITSGDSANNASYHWVASIEL